MTTTDKTIPNHDTPLTKEQIECFKAYSNINYDPIIVIEEVKIPGFLFTFHNSDFGTTFDLLDSKTWKNQISAYLCWSVLEFKCEICLIGEIYDLVNPRYDAYYKEYSEVKDSLSKKKRKKLEDSIWPARKRVGPCIISKFVIHPNRIEVTK